MRPADHGRARRRKRASGQWVASPRRHAAVLATRARSCKHQSSSSGRRACSLGFHPILSKRAHCRPRGNGGVHADGDAAVLMDKFDRSRAGSRHLEVPRFVLSGSADRRAAEPPSAAAGCAERTTGPVAGGHDHRVDAALATVARESSRVGARDERFAADADWVDRIRGGGCPNRRGNSW
jgi:hypothetical protein